MYKFHRGLYTDVRIEDVFETIITFTIGEMTEYKIRNYKAAFVRVYDGTRWYYSSNSQTERIQEEIDKLSVMAKPDSHINDNPIVKKFEVNKGEFLNYSQNDVLKVSEDEKIKLLKQMFSTVEDNKYIKNWAASYIDCKKVKEFYSSKGAEIKFDTQRCGFRVSFAMSEGERKFGEAFQKGSDKFDELLSQEQELKGYIDKCEDFLLNAKPVEKGIYTVVLSPVAAGVFAHESFGHKSESDFMVADETMKKEWTLGNKVGSDILTIIDDGNKPGSGFCAFDDEGTRARKTYLIKNGILAGRLHNCSTAATLQEDLTGNARSINFEYEPIVRMTTTYIEGGQESKEELFSKVKNGIYIENISHGSGMSTFTIAPTLAYMIRDGEISEPVNISVITGNVFKTLSEVDGVSNEVELLSFVTGGCGKMEQYPLPVGFGGPYVRVNNINVQ